LCLIVEDLEHADPGTQELVRMIIRLRRRMSLTLIVSHHPDELLRGHPAAGLLHELTASTDVEHVALEPLSADELLLLVESLQGERPTLGFMAAVMEGSGGNPMIATQLVLAHQRHAGIRLSDPIEEIIHARLAQFERQPLRALRLLAAARVPLAADELASLKLPDGHLPRTALTEVQQSGLATVDESDGRLAVHQLVAEAIDHSTLPAERHALHAALAEANAAEPAVAAWHRVRALQPARAREAHLAAATAAEAVEPGSTTLANYSAALELDADGAAGSDILAAAAAAAYASGSFRHAATLAEQALERLAEGRVERLLGPRSAPATRERAALLTEQLGRYRRSSGDLVGGRAALEQAVELAPAAAGATRAHVLASLAQDLMLDGRFDDSATRAEQARQAASSAGDDALADLAHATDTLAVDLGFSGQIDRALALLDQALVAARAAGRLDELMRCYANKTTLLDLDSRREQALAVVKEGITEAKRGGLGLTYGAFLRGNAADILFQLGRWQESEDECRAALEFPPAGLAWFSPILYLGLVLVESRADEEAARLVGQTLLQLEAVPAGQWSALVLRTAVSLALWRGEINDALAAAEQGWARVLETDDPVQVANAAATVLEACAAAAERGRTRRDWSSVADAGALAARVIPVAEERLARHPLPSTVGARREAELYLATARAHADRVRGRAQPEPWAQLAEAWAALPVPYNVAKARWWQTQALLPHRPRRAEARRALTEAWKISGRLPAAPLRRALSELAERGRIRLPEDKLVAIPVQAELREMVAVGPGPAPAGESDLAARIGAVQRSPAAGRFGLSPRESSVLVVLTEGRTNREIAERLFISERTVAVHVRRILAKLGVSGRVEAAGLAIRLGLVPDDPRLTSGTRAGRG
jgi:DNA-binding CsgD family transcriptional regulator